MAILNVRFWLNCLRHEYYHLDSHALWQFTFTAADRDAAVCNSSGGWNHIWKIMEMYLRRWCFISVWALWKIKISLCLWEVRGWGWEGLAVCERKCVRRCKSFSADGFQVRLCVVCAGEAAAATSFWAKLPGKMWQKVQITSWRQPLPTSCCEVKNISPPHLTPAPSSKKTHCRLL